jgi:hypothetical protein
MNALERLASGLTVVESNATRVNDIPPRTHASVPTFTRCMISEAVHQLIPNGTKLGDQ